MPNFKQFRLNHFRPILFTVSILLSTIMLIAASWQWERYNEKLVLVETYQNNLLKNNATELDLQSASNEKLKDLWNKRIRVKGKFDYDNQFLIGNRRSKVGAGFWLMTPFKTSDGKNSALVSRGFIPFEDSDSINWTKYDSNQDEIEISGVLTQSVGKRTVISPSSTTRNHKVLLYPDLEQAQKLIPYPIIKEFYIQGILDPIANGFPMTDIRIDVPPSTHFWYTIEWIILAIMVQVVSFLYQLFRPKNKYKN